MIILRRDAGPRGSLRSALSVAAAFRGAVLKLAPQPVPEFLSGHAPESTPENPVRSERPHVSLVALPFVGSPHATGDLMGVAALLPGALTNIEREICWGTIGKIGNLQMPWGRWEVSVADAEENRRALPEHMVAPASHLVDSHSLRLRSLSEGPLRRRGETNRSRGICAGGVARARGGRAPLQPLAQRRSEGFGVSSGCRQTRKAPALPQPCVGAMGRTDANGESSWKIAGPLAMSKALNS